MRVVFLTHNYPRHPGDLAGAFLHPLAVALQQAGHHIRVVAPSEAGQDGEDVLDGIPVRRVRYAAPTRERYAYTGTMQSALRSPGGWRAIAGLLRAFRKAAREEAPVGSDVVIHAHWWVPAGLASPPGHPAVLTVHGTDGTLLDRSAAARWLARPTLRRMGVLTAVSSSLARSVAATAAIEVDRCRIQPMPVDTTGWGWGRGGAGCLVVARLTAQKRVHLVLDALARLKQAGREVPCTIVGDGPERESLERLVIRRGLGAQVRFAGRVAPNQVHALLMEADVAIAPFRNEGFGLTAAEALMTGVPVVACLDGGGLLDIVPPAGGGRLTRPDGPGIAAAITALLESPAERDAAREAGTAWRQRLAPATVAARFAGWYQEALGA